MKKYDTVQFMKSRFFVFSVFLSVLLFILVLLSLCLGAVRLSVKDVFAVFFSESSLSARNIVLYVRLPRTIAGIAGGAALSLSGAIIQSVLRNPLGSPNVVGVNSGALFFLLLSTLFFHGNVFVLPLSAFLGAVFASSLVCVLGSKAGGSKYTVILSGVVLNTLFTALSDVVQVFAPDSIYARGAFRIGSLSLVQPKILLPAVVCIVLSFVASLFLSDSLDVLSLGDEEAASLGLNVKSTRVICLVVASLLAGSSVSFSGLIGFVGLIVPHVVRSFSPSAMRFVLPLCALGGAVLVLLCDLVSRLLFAPYELPVGILLSILGGSFFVFLLLKKRMVE